MNIPIKEDEIILTPEQQERMYWAQIKYDSHKWIEYHKGYYKCEFCDSFHTSMLSFENVNICKKNPNLFPTDNQTPTPWKPHQSISDAGNCTSARNASTATAPTKAKPSRLGPSTGPCSVVSSKPKTPDDGMGKMLGQDADTLRACPDFYDRHESSLRMAGRRPLVLRASNLVPNWSEPLDAPTT